MYAIGLTGGIGCGKSAAAEFFVEHGAVLIDADLIAREVVQRGTPTHSALVKRFGTSIVDATGNLDRGALAAMTFGNPQALRDLNAITHPPIGIEMLNRLEKERSGNKVVVLAIPLLRAEHRSTMRLDAVAVVDCPFELALDRLVFHRGMDREDAEARIASQISREDRKKDGDYVIDNSGDLDALRTQIDAIWTKISSLSKNDA